MVCVLKSGIGVWEVMMAPALKKRSLVNHQSQASALRGGKQCDLEDSKI